MIEIIKVSSRGQVVIPESFRKAFNIQEGSRLIVRDEDNKMILEVEKNVVDKLNNYNREKQGWMAIAEKNMEKIWDNAKDEEEWKKYL